MKRMYVVLGVISLLLFWTFSSMGQKKAPTQKEQIQKRLELRAEMHRRMMDKILNGNGPDQDLFKDMEQLFEDSMSDSLTGFEQEDYSEFFGDNNHFQSEWIQSETGKTLVITPQSKEQNLDIKVDQNLVTIKGKSEVKTSTTVNVSDFNKSFSVPSDCDGAKVKIVQKNGKILVEFPFKMSKNPSLKLSPIPRRKPLPPSGQEVEI